MCAEGRDYIGTNGTLIIHAPTCSARRRLSINDDDIFEGREHFSFTLSTNQPRVHVSDATPHGNIYIVDNDGEIWSASSCSTRACELSIVRVTGPLVTVGLMQQRYSVHEGGSVRICAHMVGLISKPLVVVIETGYSPDLIGSKCKHFAD